jgi:protein-S-isoprenylcysteine O-methyltransferase
VNLDAAGFLGIVYALSEVGLAIAKRANNGGAHLADAGSLRQIWIVIVLSVAIAFALSSALPAAGMGGLIGGAKALGIVLYVLGLILRWYAIIYLGRFFTVNVAIAEDHRLIDSGPYRYVRHPSYTGALMAFLGLGLCIGNWASITVLVAPIFWIFLRRMHVEEAALLEALGNQYRNYMNRTKRLIPAVY